MGKIVFCGGGTAGHVMPNIAIIEELKGKGIELHYIGGAGIEKQILANYPYVKYHEISTPKFIRKITLKNFAIPFKLTKSTMACKKLLKEIKPSVIFSKGGYISVPVVIASGKIPVIGHESDYTMGLANKIIYKHADKMYFSFEDTAKKYPTKGEFSGTAIRKSIINGDKQKLSKQLNIGNSLPTILVVGGSSGARAINQFIINNLNILTQNYNIVHIIGAGNEIATTHTKNYYPISYADNMGDYIALADYIISRAGSNAIFEFLALNKPMILIPLPKEESRGDQILNAQYFKKQGFAEVIEQKDLSVTAVLKKLEQLKSKKKDYINTMQNSKSQNGTQIIIKELLKYVSIS